MLLVLLAGCTSPVPLLGLRELPSLFGAGDEPRALCVPSKHSINGASVPAQGSSLCAGLQEHAGRGQGLMLGVIFCSPPFF